MPREKQVRTTGQGQCRVRILPCRTLDNVIEGVPLEQIVKAADRSATAAGQLLAFSRQQTLQPEVANVDSLTGDVMKSLAQTLDEDT